MDLSVSQFRELYSYVTGFETRITARDYLCEALFKAIEAHDLPFTEVVRSTESSETVAESSVQSLDEVDEVEEEQKPEEPEERRPFVKFILSEKPIAKVKYSRREKVVFDTLVKAHPEPITSKFIIDNAFKKHKGFHVSNTVIVCISSLRRKIEFNQEPFRLCTSSNSGPKPMSCWLEQLDKSEATEDEK